MAGDGAWDKEGDTFCWGNWMYFVNSGDQERVPGPKTLMGDGDFVPGALITQPDQKQGVFPGGQEWGVWRGWTLK